MADRLRVLVAGKLLDVLAAHFATWTKNTLRQRLAHGCVLVNGAVTRRPDHALAVGDTVEVVAKGQGPAAARDPLPVLWRDDDLIAVDKPVGLLSVAADDDTQPHALGLMRQSLSSPGREVSLWPVHRLDRQTSGVLLLARSREVNDRVQAQWQLANKIYLAIVEGVPATPTGEIDEPLWQDENLRVRVGSHPSAKNARTRYRTLQTGSGRALLEVELDTGRKHQIRAHLAFLGHPIVGDDRYGQRDLRMGLHALRLSLPHPRDGRVLTFEAPPPPAFLALLPGRGGNPRRR